MLVCEREEWTFDEEYEELRIASVGSVGFGSAEVQFGNGLVPRSPA